MTSTDTLLSTKEFSERSGMSTATVQKWLRSGKIAGTKKNRRWYIPSTELTKTSATVDAPQPRSTEPTSHTKPACRTYSIAEFSALTYLTEFGVGQWLKAGRLLGERAVDGSWQVKAESFDLPHVKHLIRH